MFCIVSTAAEKAVADSPVAADTPRADLETAMTHTLAVLCAWAKHRRGQRVVNTDALFKAVEAVLSLTCSAPVKETPGKKSRKGKAAPGMPQQWASMIIFTSSLFIGLFINTTFSWWVCMVLWLTFFAYN